MTPDTLALKRATAETIKGVGGLEAAADFCRVGKSVLSDNQSPNRADSFIAIDVVADLEPLARERAGWPHVKLEATENHRAAENYRRIGRACLVTAGTIILLVAGKTEGLF